MSVIQTTALTKFYGKERGITDVNLTVEEGDFFGFIGPNGAGKSTTIRTLLGLIRPTSGRAYIFGKPVTRDNRALLAELGYLPSEAMFYDGMRVREVIRLSAKLRGMDCTAEAERLCERLALDTSRRVDELSLGNRKKVAIVCAFQHRPRLYVLDEPTSGLDPLMQREFFAILKERNCEGATIFLSSHVLSEIARYCRHAAVLREGRVIASDRVEALRQTGAKRVTLHGPTQLPSLAGMRDLRLTPDGLTFLYAGDINVLLQTLAAEHLEDLVISEPDLEEVFLHYYDGGIG
ncbi:MAG: ABC transporter ATP-binding protein [Eubacteriales bacterium]